MLGSLLLLSLWIVWAGLAFMVLYLLLLTVAALRPVRPMAPARRTRTFRIVMPAHNEELVLAPVLRKLLSLDYPRDHFEIVVIADNCSDETAELARKYGVRVVERFNTAERGKGHALAHAFSLLRNEAFDAYVVLDADTLVEPNLLNIFNRYLEAGHRVVQAHYDVLNPWENRRTALMYVAMCVFNYVRPLGRRALGFSTGLKGNGMCFHKAIIDRYAWNAFSLAEDIEYTTTLLVHGERIMFAPEAKVAAQMPVARKQATSQRLRWEAGRLELARRDGFRLIALGLRRLNLNLFDWGMDLVIPPLAALTLLILGGTALTIAGAMIVQLTAFAWLVSAWISLLIALVAFVTGAMWAGHIPRAGYIAILSAPTYVLWKLWIYGTIFIRRTPQSWIRTDRTQMQDQ